MIFKTEKSKKKIFQLNQNLPCYALSNHMLWFRITAFLKRKSLQKKKKRIIFDFFQKEY